MGGVLIAQAPISSASDIIAIVLFFSGLAVCWKKIDLIDNAVDKTGFKIICGFIGSIVALIVVYSMSTILAGFFNPEYWAIKQILGN